MDKSARHQHWAGLLKEQAESGLSKKAFCAARGINAATFYYWQRRRQALVQDEQRAGFQQLMPQGEHELNLRLSGGEVIIRSRSLAALGQVLQALGDA